MRLWTSRFLLKVVLSSGFNPLPLTNCVLAAVLISIQRRTVTVSLLKEVAPQFPNLWLAIMKDLSLKVINHNPVLLLLANLRLRFLLLGTNLVLLLDLTRARPFGL